MFLFGIGTYAGGRGKRFVLDEVVDRLEELGVDHETQVRRELKESGYKRPGISQLLIQAKKELAINDAPIHGGDD